MKVMVVGCGSIGIRHIRNLLCMKEIDGIIVCTKNAACSKVFPDENKIEYIADLSDLFIVDDHSRTTRPEMRIDFAIIANETSRHIDTAIFLAEHGINLFIEKPLSHNLDKVNLLCDIAEQKHLKTFIGYNLRFLGALRFIKGLISRNELGVLYFASIEVGQYLPSWRPSIDYRYSYSAGSRSDGGGVALDLSHEVDYMRLLFGEPSSWKVMRAKVSTLEIKAEDVFKGLYQYSDGFICSVHMDYLQTQKKREIRIVGSTATLVGDLINRQISIEKNGVEELLEIEDDLFDTSTTYIEELKHFIRVVEGKEEPTITIHDGIKTLQLLEEGYV